MESEAAFRDHYIRPDTRSELLLADNLARPFGEKDQDVQGAAAQPDWNAVFLDQSSFGKQTERTESGHIVTLTQFLILHVDDPYNWLERPTTSKLAATAQNHRIARDFIRWQVSMLWSTVQEPGRGLLDWLNYRPLVSKHNHHSKWASKISTVNSGRFEYGLPSGHSLNDSQSVGITIREKLWCALKQSAMAVPTL